jgi:hypothetical protein
MKGLNRLINKIGETPAKRFLKLTQKQLKQDHQELLKNLQQQEWQKAADKAHYLKATANLYASESLLMYYALIEQKKGTLRQDSLFIEALSQEFKRVEHNIQVFLD